MCTTHVIPCIFRLFFCCFFVGWILPEFVLCSATFQTLHLQYRNAFILCNRNTRPTKTRWYSEYKLKTRNTCLFCVSVLLLPRPQTAFRTIYQQPESHCWAVYCIRLANTKTSACTHAGNCLTLYVNVSPMYHFTIICIIPIVRILHALVEQNRWIYAKQFFVQHRRGGIKWMVNGRMCLATVNIYPKMEQYQDKCSTFSLWTAVDVRNSVGSRVWDGT